MAGMTTPPSGHTVPDMAEPRITITDADLALLLQETDRDDPILAAPRRPAEPRESLDSQILAGLVSP
jgi:hypothetical protein